MAAFLPWWITTEGHDVISKDGFAETRRGSLFGLYTAVLGGMLMVLGSLRTFVSGAQGLRHWFVPIMSLILGGGVTVMAYLTRHDITLDNRLDSSYDPPIVHEPGLGLWITLGLGGGAVLVALLALVKRK